ncbi:MAG: 4-(cytidine 5'-diphospho)-2-C-methyl-D-erythritol kinase [Steroidobacteraceae bacterium]
MSDSVDPRSSIEWWPAPAKLNLWLHVTGRRDDGYHDLQTLFQIIDLCDELSFELTDDPRILRVDDQGAEPGALQQVATDDDLCVRAGRLLREQAGAAGASLPGVQIRVRKRIPMGGGLGGGSSDAATSLRVLNHLWGLKLDRLALAELGLRLGADVPVFIHGQSAYGEGRGERLEPAELSNRWYLVLQPPVTISTREIFQAPELTRNSPVLTIAGLIDEGRNDFEPVVRQRYPEVARALDWLGAFATARLSGTGACIFARFHARAEAERVRAEVPAGWRAWAVQGLQCSPLESRLD